MQRLRPAKECLRRQPREEPARRHGWIYDALDHRPPAIVAVELDGFITGRGHIDQELAPLVTPMDVDAAVADRGDDGGAGGDRPLAPQMERIIAQE